MRLPVRAGSADRANDATALTQRLVRDAEEYDMRVRSVTAVAAAAILLLGLPVQAQDGSRSVSFDGVGFGFDKSLGTSVNITQVPGQPADLQQPGGPDLRHVAFTLYGPKAEGAKVPRVGDAPGVVRAYRIADLAGYDEATQQLEQLTGLLADRPDLGAFTAVSSDGSGDALPYLPTMPASQVIRARAQYVDTPELSGVAYLTAYRQDVSPFAAGDFWYTFQGLSTDGEWYVAVDFVVDASMFPAKVTAKDANRMNSANAYAKYLTESVLKLNDATPEAFAPPLTAVDALVRSITFDGLPAPEPSSTPAGSPTPSPSAAPEPSSTPAGSPTPSPSAAP